MLSPPSSTLILQLKRTQFRNESSELFCIDASFLAIAEEFNITQKWILKSLSLEFEGQRWYPSSLIVHVSGTNDSLWKMGIMQPFSGLCWRSELMCILDTAEGRPPWIPTEVADLSQHAEVCIHGILWGNPRFIRPHLPFSMPEHLAAPNIVVRSLPYCCGTVSSWGSPAASLVLPEHPGMGLFMDSHWT